MDRQEEKLHRRRGNAVTAKLKRMIALRDSAIFYLDLLCEKDLYMAAHIIRKIHDNATDFESIRSLTDHGEPAEQRSKRQ